jgi:hypothetical protein
MNYATIKIEREKSVDELVAQWSDMLGQPPSRQQFVYWVTAHGAEATERAIIRTARRNLALNCTMDSDYRVKYTSSVLNNMIAGTR